MQHYRLVIAAVLGHRSGVELVVAVYEIGSFLEHDAERETVLRSLFLLEQSSGSCAGN